ncbi:hypothetical protein DBR33_19020, partial [Stenotrophomonas sp. HMWF022]
FGGTRWAQPQVSQWISESNPKSIGHRLARDLESAMQLPHGTLDRADQDVEMSLQSQSTGLDFEKMSAAVKVLSHYLELVGDPPEWIYDPVLLETAFMVVDAFGQPSAPDNVLDLTKLLAKRIREAKDDSHATRGARTAVGR